MVAKRLLTALATVMLLTSPLAAQQSYITSPVSWLSDVMHGCDSSCSDTCSHCRNWYVGVEATFLSPIFNDNPLDFTFTDIVGGTTTQITSDFANAEYLAAAPRVWLGMTGSHGWGMALRYWQMQTAGTATDVLDPVGIPGDTTGYNISNIFDAYTLDLEGTRDFCYGDWDMLASFGVRHAAIDRSDTLSSMGLAGVDFISTSASSERQFNGIGLTGSLAGTRAINCCDLEWFYRARASVLWGDNDTFVTTAATVVGPGGSAFSVNGANATSTDELIIGELQTGLMWARDIESVNSRVFASIAVEYQYWNAGAGDAAAISAAGNAGVSAALVSASSRNLRTHLVGFAIGAGYEW